ncbi:LytTR family DNA-binding domain-containing protein [Clostridium sp. C2-6-12]|uniref:LytR/AlgR family response regulator transcription factor n=1 Tax=Clostridium sp. C2-6-12 TaxID=2698832 RepID=UPI00136FD29B|nr:LytTR family DNA-binding domain-containing protein [Clostridium sp. C2-6-12]
MLKIAICEDDIIQRHSIANLIKKGLASINKKYELFEFCSGEKLLSSLGDYHIYFLDIEMDTISGIDIAKKIRTFNENPIIIFTTGYKNYVYDAFDVNAFHYLIKPIDEMKFEKVLFNAIKSLSPKDKFLIAKINNSLTKIYLKDIQYIESEQRKIKIHTTYDVIEYYYKISDLEVELMQDDFFRCHKSFIVNLKYVQSFDNTFITLKNSEKVFISRYKLADFSKAFMYYLKNEGL